MGQPSDQVVFSRRMGGKSRQGRRRQFRPLMEFDDANAR